MTESYYSRIERSIDSFPSLPSTVADVMRVINNPESSAKELTQAILPDQSMCVAILKLANSVLYGRPKKVSSIEKAIMVLGFDEIQSIVLSRAVLSSFGDVFRKNDHIIGNFWDHSFTCALASKTMAEHFNISSSGRFFIGGLIHDIGKLAMLLTFPDEYPIDKWLIGFSTQDKLAEERSQFGTTHEDIASRLLKKWDFPVSLTNALKYHHNPGDSPENQGFALILQVADALSHLCTDAEAPEQRNVVNDITDLLPEAEELWSRFKMPWERYKIEMWYNWLVIERKHGSSILAILTC